MNPRGRRRLCALVVLTCIDLVAFAKADPADLARECAAGNAKACKNLENFLRKCKEANGCREIVNAAPDSVLNRLSSDAKLAAPARTAVDSALQRRKELDQARRKKEEELDQARREKEKAAFAKLKTGMTVEEVETIVGRIPDYYKDMMRQALSYSRDGMKITIENGDAGGVRQETGDRRESAYIYHGEGYALVFDWQGRLKGHAICPRGFACTPVTR